MKKWLRKITPTRVATYLFLIALVTFTALPLVYLVSSAFKPLNELFVFPPRFFVRHPTMANFSELLFAVSSSAVPFARYFFNSVLVSVLGVGVTVIVCSMATYAITKLELPFAGTIFSLIIAALMFSPPVAQLSNYVLINQLHLMNTYWALILPKAAGAYYFFLMRQNLILIPNAIIESARIDGCGAWKVYTKMILPLSKPVLATIVVFAFVANWNDFYSPLIYINNEVLKTLPLALQMLQGGTGQVARSGAVAAALLLTTAPTILVFTFMQSKVINTMAHTGIK